MRFVRNDRIDPIVKIPEVDGTHRHTGGVYLIQDAEKFLPRGVQDDYYRIASLEFHKRLDSIIAQIDARKRAETRAVMERAPIRPK